MVENNLISLILEALQNDVTTMVVSIALFVSFIFWLVLVRPSYKGKVIDNNIKALAIMIQNKSDNIPDELESWLSQYFVINQVDSSKIQLSADGKKALLKVPAEDVVSLTVPYHGESNMPSLMTTIGVLGTFAGITLGIQPLDIGLTQGSDDLLKGAGVLVAGMKTAFVTSLIGLFFAALSMILLSYRQKSYDNECKSWVNQLKQVAVLADPFSPLMALASPERQQADKKAMRAAESMASAADAMQQSLSGFNAEAIGEKVAGSIEHVLQDKMMPVFSNMESSLSSIQERMQNQNEEVLESLISNLRTEVIEPLAKRVEDSVEVSEEVAQAVKSLNEDLSGLEDAMSNTVKRIVDAGSELVSQSQRMLESKNHIQELLEVVGATKATMMNQLEETAKHLGRSVSGLNNQYETLNSAIQEQMTGIMRKNEEYLEEIGRRHQKLFDEHDRYTSEILEHIEKVSNNIAAVADDIRDSVSEIVTSKQ